MALPQIERGFVRRLTDAVWDTVPIDLGEMSDRNETSVHRALGDKRRVRIMAELREHRSGLVHVRDVLRGVDSIRFVEFGHRDVVRHQLVQRIVEAYKEHTDERNR